MIYVLRVESLLVVAIYIKIIGNKFLPKKEISQKNYYFYTQVKLAVSRQLSAVGLSSLMLYAES